MPRHIEDFFVPNCDIFSASSIFKCNRQNKCNFSIISSDIVPTSSRRKRRIIVHGSVIRYGPRASCQRKGLTKDRYEIFGGFIIVNPRNFYKKKIASRAELFPKIKIRNRSQTKAIFSKDAPKLFFIQRKFV